MRRFPVLVTLAMLLALPQSASAAFGVVPFVPLGDNATCLRPSGEPGGLAMALGNRVALGSASASGVRAGAAVTLSNAPAGCPAVAAREGGAAVAAQAAIVGRATVVRAAIREPGHAFSAPVTIARLGADTAAVAAAVAPDGSAVVAIYEATPMQEGVGAGLRQRLLAVRRQAGGAFGPAEVVAGWRRGDGAAAGPLVGMDDSGAVTVAVQRPVRHGPPAPAGIAVALAAPNHPFAPPTVLEKALDMALAVAPDGRTLLAAGSLTGVHVFERAPGAPGFGAPSSTSSPSGGIALDPTAALEPDGSAVVAWRTGPTADAGVGFAARTGPGPFAPSRTIGREASSGGGFDSGFDGQGVFDVAGARLRSVAGPGGRFALSWGAASGDGGPQTAHVLAGMLASDPGQAGAAPVLVRAPASVAPVAGADGTLAVGWTDGSGEFLAGSPLATTGGRLHAAILDSPHTTGSPVPGFDVRDRRPQRLYPTGSARLTVTCVAACDVSADGTLDQMPSGGVTRSRATPGPLTVGFPVADFGSTQRFGRRELHVRLRVSAPAGERIATRRLVLPVDIRRPPTPPTALGVAAVRDGHDIVVTFHVRRSDPGLGFVVAARARRGGGPIDAVGLNAGRRHRFRVRVPYVARARYVAVYTLGVGGGEAHAAPVRIRG